MESDNSVLKFSDLIGSDDTFDNIIANIHTLKKELKELANLTNQKATTVNPNDEKAVEELIKKVDELAKANKLLDEQLQALKKTKKKVNDLTDEELILREKQKIENRERVQRAKQIAILRKAEIGSIEALRAQLTLTTLKWKKLKDAERESTAEGKKLVQQKKQLTEQLKRLEKQTGDTRRNVGNYTSSLGKLGRTATRIFLGPSLVSGIRSLGQAFITLAENNKDTNESAKSLFDTISNVKEGFKELGLKIIEFVAEPIKNMIDGLDSITKKLFGFSIYGQKASEKVRNLQMAFNSEIETLKRGNISQAARNQLIKDINKKYKDYLPRLIKEKDGINEITIAQNKANESFEKKILLYAAEEEMMDLAKKRLKLLREEAHLNAKSVRLENKRNRARVEGKSLGKSGMNVDLIYAQQDLDKNEQLIRQNKRRQEELAKSEERLKAIMEAEGIKIGDFLGLGDDDDDDDDDDDNNNYGNGNGDPEPLENQNELKNRRLEAIERLQKELLRLEAENIKDRKEQALRLEQLRFNEEKKQRESNFDELISLTKKELKIEKEILIKEFGEKSQEVIDFENKAAEELRAVKKLNQQLEKEQLKRFEQNKLDIIKRFAEKAQEAPKAPKLPPPPSIENEDLIDEAIRNDIGLLSERQKNERDFNRRLTDEKIKNIKDENERKLALNLEYLKRKREDILSDEKLTWEQKQQLLEQLDKEEANFKKSLEKEKTKETFKSISETSQKIISEIQNVFNKQSAFMDKLVQEQSGVVEEQRKRAEQGLNNTLKFEQEQLAKREAEKIRSEQRAKQAAEIIALYNLVSAHAASGDKNALERGLIDFSILKAFSEGFKDGGYTGDAATDAITGHVHGQEYVVTASNTKKYGLIGKSGDQFGEVMTDYFNQNSPLLNNNFGHQRSDFEGAVQILNNNVDLGSLQSEFVKLRKTFERMPRTEVDVVWLTDYVIELTEKTIRGKMTKVNQQTRRLNGRY